ncbi:MAG: tetratricopeptide repeat protein [Myxococcota bacterium]
MLRTLAAMGLVVASLGLACSSELDLREVRSLHDEKRFEETIDPLREELAQNPDRREASLLLGSALGQAKRYGEAIFHLKRAARDGEFEVEAGIMLATTLLAMENFEAAIEASDRVLKKDPTALTAWLARGQAALLLSKTEITLESADRALALEPSDVPAQLMRAGALMILGRDDEAERSFGELFARAPEVGPEAVASACTGYARFQLTQLEDGAAARATLDACSDVLIHEALWVDAGARLYASAGDLDAAMALVRRALEANPGNHAVRILLADELIRQGRNDEAEAELLAGVELPDGVTLWTALADQRREDGDFAGSVEAIDRALESRAGDSESFHFFRADALIDMDRLAEAETESSLLTEPVYRDIIDGRIALERGSAARALALFDKALQQWPDHAGVRILAARAAYELGEEERALADLREATRASPTDTDAALLLARLYLLRGEPEEAYGFVLRHFEHRGFADPAVLLLAAEASRATGDLGRARRAYERLSELPGQRALGVSELAALVAETEGTAEARALIASRDLDLTDPENDLLLRRAVRLELDEQKPRAALALLDELLSSDPDHTSAHAIRAHVLLELGDREGAKAGFEAALERDEEHAESIAGLANLALLGGDAATAVASFERAVALAPGEPAYRYGLAQAHLAGNNAEAAEQQLRQVVRTHPEHAAAANDLAWLLAVRGESLDHALLLAERAVRIAPSPESRDTLGFVHLRSGDLEAAQREFRDALSEKPDYATARYHLALTYLEQGKEAEARAALERALSGAPFAESAEARKVLARLSEE